MPIEKRDAVPPNDILAEQAVLGAMLIEPEAIDKATALLTCSDFQRTGHDTIFTAAVTLRGRGETVDLVTLPRVLDDYGELAAVGGKEYLVNLYDTVPTAASVEHYAKIVLDLSLQRQAQEGFQRLANAASVKGADRKTLQAQALKLIERLEERAPGKKAVPKRKTIAERTVTMRAVADPPALLPYLFGPYLNEGAAHWLTGMTGIGKSTLLYNLLPALAEGRDLWGVSCTPRRILYADMESGILGCSLKALRLLPDRAVRPALDNLIMLQEPIKLPEELDALLAFVQEQAIEMVVFDTARRCFSVKDENDNAEVYNRVVPTLDALKALGVATLTMGHPAKNGNGSTRGAGAQEDAGDINLSLMMHNGMDIKDPNGIIALRVTKNRLLGLGIQPLFLRRAGGDKFEPVTSDGPPIETSTEKTKAAQCQDAIIAYLVMQPDGYATYTGIMQAMKHGGFTPSTAKRAFEECKEQRFVLPALHERYPKGGWVQNDPFAEEENSEEAV